MLLSYDINLVKLEVVWLSKILGTSYIWDGVYIYNSNFFKSISYNESSKATTLCQHSICDFNFRLNMKEGEKGIYRMARARDRKTRDFNQVKLLWTWVFLGYN